MSYFLNHLASRVLGESPVIRPLIDSMFAPPTELRSEGGPSLLERPTGQLMGETFPPIEPASETETAAEPLTPPPQFPVVQPIQSRSRSQSDLPAEGAPSLLPPVTAAQTAVPVQGFGQKTSGHDRDRSAAVSPMANFSDEDVSNAEPSVSDRPESTSAPLARQPAKRQPAKRQQTHQHPAQSASGDVLGHDIEAQTGDLPSGERLRSLSPDRAESGLLLPPAAGRLQPPTRVPVEAQPGAAGAIAAGSVASVSAGSTPAGSTPVGSEALSAGVRSQSISIGQKQVVPQQGDAPAKETAGHQQAQPVRPTVVTSARPLTEAAIATPARQPQTDLGSTPDSSARQPAASPHHLPRVASEMIAAATPELIQPGKIDINSAPVQFSNRPASLFPLVPMENAPPVETLTPAILDTAAQARALSNAGERQTAVPIDGEPFLSSQANREPAMAEWPTRRPSLQVSIGRVEVRAMPPPPPPPPPPKSAPARTQPVLSLNDYLKQRRERRR